VAFRIVLGILALLALYGVYEVSRLSMMYGAVRKPDAAFQVSGPEDAKLTFVEFIDYGCHYCRITHPAVRDFLNLRKDIRYVARPIPILGDESDRLARLALAAGLQGKFSEMHEAFLSRGENDPIDDKFIRETTALYGLDPVRLIADSEGKEVRGFVDDNLRAADRAGISSTPAFFIGKTVLENMKTIPGTADFLRIAETAKE